MRTWHRLVFRAASLGIALLLICGQDVLCQEALIAPGKFVPTYGIKYAGTEGWPPVEEAARFDLLDVSGSINHTRYYTSEYGNTYQTLKHFNPHIKIVLYQSGPATYNTASWGGLGAGWEWIKENHGINSDDRWTAVGVRYGGYLQGKPYPNARLMYPGNQNWQEFWVEEAYIKFWTGVEPIGAGADGIFADNTGYFLPGRGNWHLEGDPAKMDDPTDYYQNGEYQAQLWKTHMNDFFRLAVPWLGAQGRKLVPNFGHMRSYPEYWQELDATAHPPFAAMEEGAFVHGWGTAGAAGNFVFLSEDEWLRQVNTMRGLNNVRALMNVHGPVLSDADDITRMDAYDASGNRAWDVLWYAMTSFLQGFDDQRRNAYMNFTVWGYSRFFWFKEFDPQYLHLGRARGEYAVLAAQAGHVYAREFDDGWVVVNPTQMDAVGVAVPGGEQARVLTHDALEHAEEQPLVEQFDLPVHRGVILLKPGKLPGNQDNPGGMPAPELSWLGVRPYAADGHAPNRGQAMDWYTFKVRYTGAAPSYVRLYLYRYGVQVAGSPYDMNPGSGDPATGQVFWFKRRLAKGTYNYFFCASDGMDTATGEPTHWTSGPIAGNRPPRLEWAGSGGWEWDPVDPQGRNLPGTEFTWKVKYIDREGDAPEYVRVHIARRSATEEGFEDEEIEDSPFDMSAEDTDYVKGVVFTYSRVLNTESRYVCWFSAREQAPEDFDSDDAYGVPSWWRRNMVWVFNAPPSLRWAPGSQFCGDDPPDGLHPNEGNVGDTFTFKVQYRDHEGTEPEYVRLHLLKWNALPGEDASYGEIPTSPYDMTTDATGFDIADYSVQVQISGAGRHRYYFSASDGDKEAIGEPSWHRMLGPVVNGAGPASAMLTSLTCAPTRAGAQVILTLSAEAVVTVEVLNIAGRPVRVVVSERPMPAGTNTLTWDGRGVGGLTVPSGVYLVKVRTADGSGAQSQTLRTVRIKR